MTKEPLQLQNDRIYWLDLAKGGAIILVVMHHVLLYLGQLDISFWAYSQLNGILKFVRMPLFFFCAGVTASFAIHRPPLLFISKRALPVIWVLAVWTALYVLFDQFLPMMRSGDAVVFDLVHPQMNLWFIWMLAIFTLAAPLIARMPPVTFLLASSAVSILGDIGLISYNVPPLDHDDVMRLVWYLPFYSAGIFWARGANESLRQFPWTFFLAGGAIFFLMYAVLLKVGNFPLKAELRLPLFVSGTCMGAGAAALLSRSGVFRAAFSWVGARSLRVFLCHQPMIALAVVALGVVGAVAEKYDPLIITAVIVWSIGGALLMTEFVRSKMSFLLSPPMTALRKMAS